MMQGVTYENTRTRQAALLLPVSEKAGLVRVNLKHGGTLVDAVYARLCPPEEQDYAEVIRTQSFADEGLTLAVSVESCPDTEGGVSVLTPCGCSRLESYPAFADEIDAYDEPCRPWVHFSLVRGWINDTNGPILIDGLYHLFYQQQAGDPHATWKLCTWGHAVSKDLFHWTEVDPVIRAPGAASGCSLIRRSDGVPCIGVSHGLYESADGCMTFQRNAQYPGFGGDSKIFWDDDAGHYVRICLGCLEDGKYRSYEWYVSPDLIHWEHTDSMYGMHECPDFFRLKLDGTGPDVGVLVCGDTSYLLGSFDGRKFTPDPIDPNRVDHWVAAHPVSEEMHPYCDRYNGHAANEAKVGWGRFFAYAYQSFSNLPNGRILRMGWLSADTPGCTSFAQCQSIPQEVTLKTTRFGPRLCQLPAPELAVGHVGEPVSVGSSQAISFTLPAADIEARYALDGAVQVGEFRFAYSRERSALRISQTGEPDCFLPYPLLPDESAISFRMIRDRGSVEIFFGMGEVYAPFHAAWDADTFTVQASANASAAVTAFDCIYPPAPGIRRS